MNDDIISIEDRQKLKEVENIKDKITKKGFSKFFVEASTIPSFISKIPEVTGETSTHYILEKVIKYTDGDEFKVVYKVSKRSYGDYLIYLIRKDGGSIYKTSSPVMVPVGYLEIFYKVAFQKRMPSSAYKVIFND